MAATTRTPEFVKLVLAFFALAALHVCLALSFKVVQHGPSADYAFAPAVVLIFAEFIKFTISSGLFWRDALHKHTVPATMEKEPAASTPFMTWWCTVWPVAQALRAQMSISLAWRTALLAFLYCVNNNLAFTLFRVADGANITLIKSGGSVVSALLLRFVLGRGISSTQWSAIWLQVFGLVVAQFGSTCSNTPLLPGQAYFLLFISLLISSGCGVWNDQLLKCERFEASSMHLINMLLYAYGFVFNGGVYMLTTNACGEAAGSCKGILAGFDEPGTYLVLACQSMFGMAISAVYKYADAAVKTFALSCATGVLMLINVVVFDDPFSLLVAMGCLTVFVASHLYVTNNLLPPKEGPDQGKSTLKVVNKF